LEYEPYYLIPGLDILAPLDLSTPADAYLLNLFCCKQSTAEVLESEGYLVSTNDAIKHNEKVSYSDFFSKIPALKNLQARDCKDQNYKQALDAYICARDESLDKKTRYQHLLLAFDVAKKALEQGASQLERLSTYARIAFDIGQRNVGVQICAYAIQKYLQNQNPVNIVEPYVPINKEFENSDPKQNETAWLLASFVDQHIRKHAFSCYFTESQAIPYFNTLKELGYLLPDMQKREQTLHSLLKQ
jgi:hypothetical protein